MVDTVVNQHIQYHLDYITDKKVFIVTMPDIVLDYSYFVSTQDITVDMTYINSCPDEYDFILIDYSTNYIRAGIEEILYNQLKQYPISKPWAIITSEFKYYYQPHEHIIYYPIYLIDGLDKGGNTPIEIKNQRSHSLCFLTYHYHWHRLLAMVEIYKNIGLDQCLVNLPTLASLSESQQQSLRNSRRYLTTDEQKHIDAMFELAPLVADATDSQHEIVNLENRAFYDSYINVFTESDYPAPFATEKCVKPFLSGQFYAVIGNPAMYQHLRDLGFDLLDDYLPISTDKDLRVVLGKLTESIANLIPNMQEVWNETYNRRLHNYNLSRSTQLRNTLTNSLRIKLKE